MQLLTLHNIAFEFFICLSCIQSQPLQVVLSQPVAQVSAVAEVPGIIPPVGWVTRSTVAQVFAQEGSGKVGPAVTTNNMLTSSAISETLMS